MPAEEFDAVLDHVEAQAKENSTGISPHHTRRRRLPTFQEMRRDALRQLGDALDVLRSDWAEGHGPTAAQAKAVQDARCLIVKAKAALDRAAR